MFRAEPLVARVVLKPAVEAFAENARLNHPPHRLEERIVPLHQVCDAKQPARLGNRQQLVRLPRIRQRSRWFFANHMFSGKEGGARLRIVQERGRGDVDQIDFRTREQRLHFHEIRHSEPARHGQCCLPVGAGNAKEACAWELQKLLQREKPETSGADRADLERLHGVLEPAPRHLDEHNPARKNIQPSPTKGV